MPPPAVPSRSPQQQQPLLLVGDRNTSDFAFVAEGREVHAHRSVLMQESPFLKSFLQDDPNCSRIVTNNARCDALVVVLRAVYEQHEAAALNDHHKTIAPNNNNNSTLRLDHIPNHERFAITLSCWEISAHFQLDRIAEAATAALAPLVQPTNVVRLLKAVAKQRQNPSAALLLPPMLELAQGSLPLQLDTADAAAEWDSLQRKHSWLQRWVERNTSIDQQREQQQQQQHLEHTSVAVVPVRSGSGGAVESSGRDGSSRHAAERNSSRSQENRQEDEPHDTPFTHHHHNHNSSVQRVRSMEQRAQQALLAEQQRDADAPIHEEIERLQAQLRQEEVRQKAAMQQWDAERAQLQQLLLEQLESHDEQILEAAQRRDALLAELEVEEAACDAADRQREALEVEMHQNAAYITSTQTYIPAATAAERELSSKIQSVRSWLVAQHNGLTSAAATEAAVANKVHHMLAEYADHLQSEKDAAVRATQLEEKEETILRRCIKDEMGQLQRLRQYLPNTVF